MQKTWREVARHRHGTATHSVMKLKGKVEHLGELKEGRRKKIKRNKKGEIQKTKKKKTKFSSLVYKPDFFVVCPNN